MIHSTESISQDGTLRLNISSPAEVLRIFRENLKGLGGLKPLVEVAGPEAGKLLADSQQKWTWIQRDDAPTFDDVDDSQAAKRWVEIAQDEDLLHLLVIGRLAPFVSVSSDESAYMNVEAIAAGVTKSVAEEDIWDHCPFGSRADDYGPWTGQPKDLRDDEYGVLAQVARWYKNVTDSEGLAPLQLEP